MLTSNWFLHYIDLYNDIELYKTFNYESTEVLHEQIHPTKDSYDLLFPTVLRLFNDTLPKAPQPEEDSLNTGVIIGIAAAGVAVVAIGGFVLYWFVIRKKKAK